MSMMSHYVMNMNKDIEIIRKNQEEIKKLKSITNKNSIESLKKDLSW